MGKWLARNASMFEVKVSPPFQIQQQIKKLFDGIKGCQYQNNQE
jgi:hypothetical protein